MINVQVAYLTRKSVRNEFLSDFQDMNERVLLNYFHLISVGPRWWLRLRLRGAVERIRRSRRTLHPGMSRSAYIVWIGGSGNARKTVGTHKQNDRDSAGWKECFVAKFVFIAENLKSLLLNFYARASRSFFMSKRNKSLIRERKIVAFFPWEKPFLFEERMKRTSFSILRWREILRREKKYAFSSD